MYTGIITCAYVCTACLSEHTRACTLKLAYMRGACVHAAHSRLNTFPCAHVSPVYVSRHIQPRPYVYSVYLQYVCGAHVAARSHCW